MHANRCLFVHVPKGEADKSFVQHSLSSLFNSLMMSKTVILLGTLRVLFLYVHPANFPLGRFKKFFIVLNGMQRIALCRALSPFSVAVLTFKAGLSVF